MGMRSDYALDLVCDDTSCANKEPRGIKAMRNYVGDDDADCLAQARSEGWRINERTGKVQCPWCVEDAADKAAVTP